MARLDRTIDAFAAANEVKKFPRGSIEPNGSSPSPQKKNPSLP
jgi:hypothetical protein